MKIKKIYYTKHWNSDKCYRIMFEAFPEHYIILSTWANSSCSYKLTSITVMKKYYNAAKFKITPEELPECIKTVMKHPFFEIDVIKAIQTYI